MIFALIDPHVCNNQKLLSLIFVHLKIYNPILFYKNSLYKIKRNVFLLRIAADFKIHLYIFSLFYLHIHIYNFSLSSILSQKIITTTLVDCFFLLRLLSRLKPSRNYHECFIFIFEYCS